VVRVICLYIEQCLCQNIMIIITIFIINANQALTPQNKINVRFGTTSKPKKVWYLQINHSKAFSDLAI
jgi:hypothetical protein